MISVNTIALVDDSEFVFLDDIVSDNKIMRTVEELC